MIFSEIALPNYKKYPTGNKLSLLHICGCKILTEIADIENLEPSLLRLPADEFIREGEVRMEIIKNLDKELKSEIGLKFLID